MSTSLDTADSNVAREHGLNNNRLESLTQETTANRAYEDVDDDVIMLDDDWAPITNLENGNQTKNRMQEEALKNDEIFARKVQEDLDREFAELVNNRESPRPNISSTINRLRRPNEQIGFTRTTESNFNQRDVSTNELPTRESNRGTLGRAAFRNTHGRETIRGYFPEISGPNSRDLSRASGRERLVTSNPPRNETFNGNETIIRAGPSINTEREFMSRAMRAFEQTERNFTVQRDQRSNRGTHRSNHLPMQFELLGRGDFNANDYERLLRLDETNRVNKGLSKQEIERLPIFDFSKPTGEQDENAITCYICYEMYEKNEKLTILTCSHKYHKKCIEKWLKESRQCPLCKKDAINGT